jgi:hypothetical protein
MLMMDWKECNSVAVADFAVQFRNLAVEIELRQPSFVSRIEYGAYRMRNMLVKHSAVTFVTSLSMNEHHTERSS